MKPLTITTSHAPVGLVLAVSGDLDHTNAQQLRHSGQEAAAVAPGRLLEVNLSDLAFCDSSGITALIAVRNHVVSAGGEVVLVAVPANMRRLLHLTGLDQVFDIRDTVSPLTDR